MSFVDQSMKPLEHPSKLEDRSMSLRRRCLKRRSSVHKLTRRFSSFRASAVKHAEHFLSLPTVT